MTGVSQHVDLVYEYTKNSRYGLTTVQNAVAPAAKVAISPAVS
ncbi:MAG: hypothetical protein ABSD85_18375 [Acidimicrobiales bacterium]